MGYLLMVGFSYYPAGPNDIVGKFYDLQVAFKEGERLINTEDDCGSIPDWFAIVDCSSGDLVASQGTWYGKDSSWR